MNDRFEHFRTTAKEHYHQRFSQEESVEVRLPPYRFINTLWVILGILVIGGILLCFLPIPSYAYGVAIVLEDSAKERYPIDEPVEIFLHAQYDGQIQPGHIVIIQLPEKSIKRKILYVEEDLIETENLQQIYGLDLEKFEAFPQPAVVLATELNTVENLSGTPSYYEGGIYNVRVKVGTRSFYWLLWELI